MPGSTLSTATSNGMNVHHADTSAQSRFGTTTVHGELVLPTNPVWQEAGTTTETSGLAQVLAVTGGLHVGYEHNFALRHGWELFVQAKCDLTLPKREDLFRTGIVIGFKIPTLKK